VSCGKAENNNIILNTEEGLSKIKKIVKDQFGLDKKIFSFNISNKNTISNEVEQISIQFVENDMLSLWFYNTQMNKLFKPEPTKSSLNKNKILELRAFNINDILTYFKQAIILVEKETKEFENFQLEGKYSMYIDETSGKIIHSFNLLANKTKKGTSFYGKRIRDNLFKFAFTTDKNGMLKNSEGLNIFEE